MPTNDEGFTVTALAMQRLQVLLQLLAEQGLTQVQIAARAGLPAQYLSDIKRGKRPMTELVARRLGEEFEVNFQWLLGADSAMENPKPRAGTAKSTLWLPLFPWPIEGEPRAHPQWDGAGVEVAGVAAAKVALTRYPYVLRFGNKDEGKRLHKGDLILISQVPRQDAELCIVRYRKKSCLARSDSAGNWERVANGELLLASKWTQTGHCVGIVWSSLL